MNTSSNYILITDGAYSSTRNQGGSAFIILKNNTPILEWSKSWKGGSNNTAELLAIIFGLKAIKHPIESLLIVSDSQYSLGVMFKGWKRNTNHKILEVFDKEYERVKTLCPKIEYKHIRGHGKSESEYNEWNEKVDKAAVLQSQRVSL